MFTWTVDYPGGPLKNHALSTLILREGVEEAHFADFIRPVPAFGARQGETVTIPRVHNIDEVADATLTEGVRIPEDTFRLSTVAVTVKEQGRSIPFSSLVDQLSEFDVENEIQAKLRQQMTLIMDTSGAAAFKTAKTKYVPTGVASSTITTNGVAGAQATANLNVFHVEEIRDYLFDTLQAEFWAGDSFFAIMRTLGMRGIRRDPAWEQWQLYTTPEAKRKFELGRLEDTRFLETNHGRALGKIGLNGVLGEAVFFGRDPVRVAEVVTPELRIEMNRNNDFGRARAVAWYGILNWVLMWDTGNAGEANVVHVSST